MGVDKRLSHCCKGVACTSYSDFMLLDVVSNMVLEVQGIWE